MTSLLFSIIAAALLSTTSLLVVLFRASPLLSPMQALPTFFISVFLAVSSLTTLALYALWKHVPLHAWDDGKILGIALRQGVLIGLATVIMFAFLLLGLLTWWIVIMIYAMFLLVELALQH